MQRGGCERRQFGERVGAARLPQVSAWEAAAAGAAGVLCADRGGGTDVEADGKWQGRTGHHDLGWGSWIAGWRFVADLRTGGGMRSDVWRRQGEFGEDRTSFGPLLTFIISSEIIGDFPLLFDSIPVSVASFDSYNFH